MKETTSINYEGLISECIDIIALINKKTYLLQNNNVPKECNVAINYDTILYTQLSMLRERLMDLESSIVG